MRGVSDRGMVKNGKADSYVVRGPRGIPNSLSAALK